MVKNKNKKGIWFIVKGTVYPFDVLFSFGQSDEDLVDMLCDNGIKTNDLDEHGLKFTYDKTCGIGRTCMLESGQVIVRMPVIPSLSIDRGILAHEIFHAAEFVLHRVGIKHDVHKSGEAYAYLIGHLTQECYYQIGQKR